MHSKVINLSHFMWICPRGWSLTFWSIPLIFWSMPLIFWSIPLTFWSVLSLLTFDFKNSNYGPQVHTDMIGSQKMVDWPFRSIHVKFEPIWFFIQFLLYLLKLLWRYLHEQSLIPIFNPIYPIMQGFNNNSECLFEYFFNFYDCRFSWLVRGCVLLVV